MNMITEFSFKSFSGHQRKQQSYQLSDFSGASVRNIMVFLAYIEKDLMDCSAEKRLSWAKVKAEKSAQRHLQNYR